MVDPVLLVVPVAAVSLVIRVVDVAAADAAPVLTVLISALSVSCWIVLASIVGVAVACCAVDVVTDAASFLVVVVGDIPSCVVVVVVVVAAAVASSVVVDVVVAEPFVAVGVAVILLIVYGVTGVLVAE